MYSFYGGQKGQDFKISRVFSNRSKDMLEDLQARWYSPINVGDYVFISYGNIADRDKEVINKDNEIEIVLSDYHKNLELDLRNCGKSYANSLWQKVYIDENKKISPNFPDSDNNVYVFINFDDSNDSAINNKIVYNGKTYFLNDEDGNWYDGDNKLIRFHQTPGHSLLETSDIYSEERYGFGYKLIACVTGETPRLDTYYEVINIEDGDPHTTLDLTIPENPKLKFYLQRAQVIKPDKVSTHAVPPTNHPSVDLVTEGQYYINDVKKNASLTYPILDFSLPRAIQYFFGILFGEGELSDSPFTVSLEEIWSSQRIHTIYGKQIKLSSTVGGLIGCLNALKKSDTINKKQVYDEIVNLINSSDERNYDLSLLKPYFSNDNVLTRLSNNSDLPIGYYGIRSNDIDRENQINLLKGIVEAINVFMSQNSFEKIKNSYDIDINNIYLVKEDGDFEEQSITDIIDKLNVDDIASLDVNILLNNQYFFKSDNDKRVQVWLKFKNNTTLQELNSFIYLNYNSEINGNSLFNIYFNKCIVKKQTVNNNQVFSLSVNYDLIERNDTVFFNNKSDVDFINEQNFEQLTLEEKRQYCNDYLDGLQNKYSPIMLAGLLKIKTPILDFQRIFIDLCQNKDENYEFKPSHKEYFLKIAESVENSIVSFKHLFTQAMQGDIYIHNPTGRIYQIAGMEQVGNEIDDWFIKARYAGALTAPAPDVDYINIPAFIQNNGIWERNKENIKSNIIMPINKEGYREQFIYEIPDEPGFIASAIPIANEEKPEVSVSIDGESQSYSIDFDLPRAVRLYNTTHLPNNQKIYNINDGTFNLSIVSQLFNDGFLSTGDLYLNIDPQDYSNKRGTIYRFRYDQNKNSCIWESQGSIVGPSGIPKPIRKEKFRNVNDVPQGTLENSNEGYIKKNYKDKISDIIDEYVSDSYPSIEKGEFIVFEVQGLYDNEGNLLDENEIVETWYVYYINNSWLTYLMSSTGGGNAIQLKNKFEESKIVENEAEMYGYTSTYLNNIIPKWEILY